MLLVEETRAQVAPVHPVQSRTETAPRAARWKSRVNVGYSERAASVAAGAVLLALGLSRRTTPGWIIAGVGGALAFRGITGRSYAYDALKINTADYGIHVEKALLVNRSPEDLYLFWRDFTNLPRIMTHLERVDIVDQRMSHWVSRIPHLGNKMLEWDAEITRDERNSVIAWRTIPGSDVDHCGEIHFTPAMGDRGTEVHVSMEYMPPAGYVGHWVATLVGESPRRQMHEDLRNFKRLMETGEIPTIEGQPRGTCTGQGEDPEDQ
ncbi:MAG TPA: SRPBCC family protein [Planctomycetota bacterium]|nr:SRPBCC family protein [Planctomycetota bacterium]